MTTESKELAFMPPKETAMVVFTGANSIDPYLAHIRAEIDAFVPDLTTKKGRDAIASMAKQDAIDAAKKAEEDKKKAIEAERQRVERERLEAERAQQELETNRIHVGLKRKEAKEALMRVCGLTEEVAKSVVLAIAQSKIDNTEIKY